MIMSLTNIKYDSRPWGLFKQFIINQEATVKLLYVKKRHRLSYQYHEHRHEFWYVVSGEIKATVNGRDITLKKNDQIDIPSNYKHRIEGVKNSVILEIAFGQFNENDIIRLNDDYKRI